MNKLTFKKHHVWMYLLLFFGAGFSVAQPFLNDFFVYEEPYFLYRSSLWLKGEYSLLFPVDGQLFSVPLAYYSLLFKCFGVNPVPFHLANGLWYGFAGFSFFWILQHFFQDIRISVLGSFFYFFTARHFEILYMPMLVYHSMAVILILWTVYFWDQSFEKGRKFYFASLLIFVIGLFTKGSLLAVPGLLLILSFYRRNEFRYSKLKTLPFWFLAFIYFGILQFVPAYNQGKEFFEDSNPFGNAVNIFLAWVRVFVPNAFESWLGSIGLILISVILFVYLMYHSKRNFSKWATTGLWLWAGFYVLLLPCFVVPYVSAYLLGRFQVYGNLACYAFAAVVICRIVDYLKADNIWTYSSRVIFLTVMSLFVLYQYPLYEKEILSVRSFNQPHEVRTIYSELQKHKDLFPKAGKIFLVNFPNIKSFSLGTTSTSWIRLLGGKDSVGVLAKADITQGQSYMWKYATDFFRSSMADFSVLSEYGFIHEIPLSSTINQKPTLLLLYRPDEKKVWHAWGLPPSGA